MADIARLLARADERLERLARSDRSLYRQGRYLGRRAMRRLDAIVARFVRMLTGAALVALAAFFWGLYRPIGISGVLLTLLAMLAVFTLLAFFPRSSFSGPALPAGTEKEPLAVLPGRLVGWLEARESDMPFATQDLLHSVTEKIRALTPELKALPADNPAHDAARRLLGVHLPRLLESYFAVPERLRQGAEASSHLKEGLEVVQGELDALGQALGQGELTQLEVEGRFLQKRYGERPHGEGPAA